MKCKVIHVKPLTSAWHIDTDQYISIIVVIIIVIIIITIQCLRAWGTLLPREVRRKFQGCRRNHMWLRWERVCRGSHSPLPPPSGGLVSPADRRLGGSV